MILFYHRHIKPDSAVSGFFVYLHHPYLQGVFWYHGSMIVELEGTVEQDDGSKFIYQYDTELRKTVGIRVLQ